MNYVRTIFFLLYLLVLLTPSSCISPHRRPLIPPDSGYARPHPCLVLPVLLAEEGDQGVLLHIDTLGEEGEAHVSI